MKPRLAFSLAAASVLLVAASPTWAEMTGVGDVMTGTVSTNLNLGQSESTLLQLLNEQQNVTLGADLDVDLTASYLGSLGGPWVAGTHGFPSAAEGTIPAGTVVRSHLVHFDPPDTDYADADAVLTFDAPILGLMATTGSLNDSDFLGLAGITYPSGARPLENMDSVEFTLTSPTTLKVVILAANTGLDELRVITTPAPGAIVLGLMGLGAVGVWMRRYA